MQIIIQSPGFKASEALEEFIQEKVGKIHAGADKVIRADVTLTKGAATEQSNNYCEIRLEIPGKDHFVKKNSSSFEHAIVECVDALHHLIEKHKGKEMSHRN